MSITQVLILMAAHCSLTTSPDTDRLRALPALASTWRVPESAARSRWSRHTKQSSLRRFHSASLLTTDWICMQTEKKILRLGENGFTASLISVWYLDQGSKNNHSNNKKNKTTTTRTELVAVITALWVRFVFLAVYCCTPASEENKRSPCCYRKGFTEEGGRCKCGGNNILFFPSFSIVVCLSLSRRFADCLSSATWRSRATPGECAFALIAMLPSFFPSKKSLYVLLFVFISSFTHCTCPDLFSANTPECCHEHEACIVCMISTYTRMHWQWLGLALKL